jgi:transposase InsO family protein
MPWKTMDVRQQRLEFVIAAKRGSQPFLSLCKEFGISRPTGYLWLRRYEQQGLPGIAERSRRPLASPRRTAAAWEQRVVEVRERYPDWGARKLQVVLAREGVALPRNTVHRILLRHGLVRDFDQHPPALQRFERAQPNELWQMDFKGPKGWPQTMGPLSVLDDHSRYVIVLAANGNTDGRPVREQLENAFQQCGVPEAMLMDHGIPWWSQQAPSGRTKLSLWLIRQGIRLCWSGVRHPQTQGKVERFHGSLQRALRRRGMPRENLQAWLDAYRWEHNHVRPHEALNMQTPASVWRPSCRRYDPRPPRWEYPRGAWVLKVDPQGKVEVQGWKWKISKALTGEWVQLVAIEDRVLVYYCATLFREIDLRLQCSTIVEHWSTQPYLRPTVKDV